MPTFPKVTSNGALCDRAVPRDGGGAAGPDRAPKPPLLGDPAEGVVLPNCTTVGAVVGAGVGAVLTFVGSAGVTAVAVVCAGVVGAVLAVVGGAGVTAVGAVDLL
jgi:hypothetical protein